MERVSLSFPKLESLGIYSPPRSPAYFKAGISIPVAKWSMPNLQEVVLQDILLDARALRTIKRVPETLYVKNFNLKSFFVDLMALDSLNILHLTFATYEVSQDHPRLDLPSLNELSLSLRVRPHKPFDNFLSVINCPNITKLTVKLLNTLDDEHFRGGRNKKAAIQHYIRHLFAKPRAF